ncbi:biotin/lipoyl-binding protein [Nautilia sp.]
MKKKIALFVFVLLIAAGLYGLYRYIVFNENYVSSNAVFVKSDSLTFLSFKLPGKIEKIYVNEGDNIKKGQLLAKLETKELMFQKNELQNNINA